MPRLISRLLKRLEHASITDNRQRAPIEPIRRPRKKSLRQALPPSPSLSPFGRTQSILLDDVNPVINAAAYTRHKSLPPRVRIRTTKRRTAAIADEHDLPRRMSQEERRWWASPYLRMLSSPVRACSASYRVLPSDFLVRLAPMRVPTPRTGRDVQLLLPDGLEHPKYKSRRSYIGTYIVCWKEALERLEEKGHYKRLSPNLTMHSLLGSHIGHVLRVRVLQELELLADRLQTRPQGSEDTTLIRKLTRAEWKSIKSTGVIPYENAVAVVVVPPLNRNPITKTRPEGLVDLGPIEENDWVDRPAPSRPLPPLSTMHPVAGPSDQDDLPDYLPSSKVPLYNGLSLFPLRSQRAALHARLSRLLMMERRSRYREHGRPETSQSEPRDKWTRGDQKASHAFLLCSDENTAKRADMAATAIALWRVRMWEGASWEEYGGGRRGWELRKT